MTSREELYRGTELSVSGAPRALRVLVVEDDRDTVQSLMLLLRTEGYEVRAAGSAKAMRDCQSDFDPDAILLDINLPDRSGYDIARDLRRTYGEDARRPVLVAITGWNKGADKILAQIAGFDHHLGKPYDPNALLRILNSISP